MNYARLFLLSLLLLASTHAYAATLSVSAPEAGAGDSFSVPIYLDTEGENVNAVEGILHIPADLTVENVTAAGSALTVFVRPPTYSVGDRTITFTGGTPGGLAPNTHALLFTVHAHAGTGTYVLTASDFTAYRNDGTGNGISIATAPITVTVGEKGSHPPVAITYRKATPLTVTIGKDASLFDGKYFAVLSGGDAGTGVDHYEIREGWFAPSLLTERFYILKNQNLDQTLQVVAVGADGSRSTSYHLAEHPGKELGVLALILLLLIGLVVLLRRLTKRRP